MKFYTDRFLICLCLFLLACKSGDKETEPVSAETKKTYAQGSFGYDLEFLQTRDSVIVLRNQAGTMQIIVSPKYQGKVFTSTAAGLEGKSFGWINYKAFKDDLDPHMNGYGGEDRLWLGPEGGQYSIFFKPGTKMEFANWHTPPAIDSEPWQLVSSNEQHVALSKDMQLLNYAGTNLQIRVTRKINLLTEASIAELLGIQLNDKIQPVGFSTMNTLFNTGNTAWTKETGAPCLWNLDMFAPSPSTTVVIPYNEKGKGKVVTADYFGEIGKDRLRYSRGTLFFKADGKSRGKLGIPPLRAKTIAGSYDALNNVLTITKFDVDHNGIYLNQEWTTSKDPLAGDAVNAYNDGPLDNGEQMGPFYEIESVSPAAFLQPGKSLSHQHSVIHFTGDKEALDKICQGVLGISIAEIEKAFN